ncbi:MAG: hypothetical protein KDK61_01905, partial [Simkania sp.]|nr:hypothetical protein [Simkania sp.]
SKLANYIITKQFMQSDPECLLLKNYLEIAIQSEDKPIKDCLDLDFSVAPNHLSKREARTLKFLFEKGLSTKDASSLLPYFEKLSKFDKIEIDLKPIEIWAYLLSDQKQEAEKLFPKQIGEITSPYYSLYGCFLAQKEGEKGALGHFESLLNVSYPPTNALLSHFLKGTIELKSPWMQNAFLWEKVQLYRQLSLYYFCLGKKRKASQYEQMIVKERENSQIPLNFI